jgi:hypothetical protein
VHDQPTGPCNKLRCLQTRILTQGPLTEELLTHVLHWYSALPIAAHWQEHIHTRVLLALKRRIFQNCKKSYHRL